MTTYRHPSGKWAYTFRFKGQRYQTYGYGSMRSAGTAEAKHREKLILPHKPPGDLLFKDICNMYLEYCEGYNSPKGYLNKKYVIEAQFKKWGRMGAEQITPAMIEAHMIIEL